MSRPLRISVRTDGKKCLRNKKSIVILSQSLTVLSFLIIICIKMLYNVQYQSPQGYYQGAKPMYFSLMVLQLDYMRKQKTYNYYLNTKTQNSLVYSHLIPSQYFSVLQTGCQSVLLPFTLQLQRALAVVDVMPNLLHLLNGIFSFMYIRSNLKQKFLFNWLV